MCVIVHCLLGGALLNFNNVITKEFFIMLFNIMITHYMKKSIIEKNPSRTIVKLNYDYMS